MRIRCLISLLILIIPMIYYPLKRPRPYTPQYRGKHQKVPFYSQKDSAWKALEMNGKCLPPCNTIGTCGCALTSVAMLFSKFGAHYTPDTLNECLDNIACPMDFELAPERCGQDEVVWNGRYSFSWWRLNRLAKKHELPVILGMTNKKDENLTHFVVIVSGSGYDASGYRMHDPELLNGGYVPLSNRTKQWNFRWLIVYEDIG